MENKLIYIAISSNTLASLIESGCIHAVDFRCLDIDSKKAVWKLFLSALKLPNKNNSGCQENVYV
jgi:hypothetical protein